MKKRKKKENPTKKCPRCGTVCPKEQGICEECGLIFSRLEIATNAEAKRHILKHDKDFIVYTKDLPKDVSRWKLILFTLFFGLVGGHYYYVGKYWKGLAMSVMFVWLILSTVFNSQILAANATTLAYFPIGIYAVSWCMSIVFVISNRFKVPVMVEQPKLDEIEKIREDFADSSKKIREEIKLETEKENANGENVSDEKSVETEAEVRERKTGKISNSNIKKRKKK